MESTEKLLFNDVCSNNDTSDVNVTCRVENGTDTLNFTSDRYTAFEVYYFILYVILVLPTVFGNSLILIAIIRFKKLRKNTYSIMIGNLAVSDLLVGVVALPLDIVAVTNSGVMKQMYEFCLITLSLLYCFMLASVSNLLLLSLERFHAIVYPLKHTSRVTKRKVFVAVAISWMFVLALGLSPLYGFRRHHNNNNANSLCKKDELLSDSFMDVLCSIVVAVMITNFVLFLIVMRIALSKLSTLQEGFDRQHLRRKVRHTVMMLMISGMFIILWGPFCVVSLVPSPSPTVLLAKDWLSSLGLINSCLNWIVFGVRSKRFRQAMKSILNCRCRKSNYDINMSTTQ